MAGVITSWVDGVQSASDAAALANTASKPVGHNGEMTLVKEGNEVVLVSWDHGGRGDLLMGRPVKIDKRGRAIYVIPGITPLRSYQQSEILIPAIGMRLEKARGRERPAIPNAVMRMMRMVLSSIIIKMAHASIKQIVECHQCVSNAVLLDDPMCSKALPRTNLSETQLYNCTMVSADSDRMTLMPCPVCLTDEDLQECPWCMLPFHNQCSKRMKDHLVPRPYEFDSLMI